LCRGAAGEHSCKRYRHRCLRVIIERLSLHIFLQAVLLEEHFLMGRLIDAVCQTVKRACRPVSWSMPPAFQCDNLPKNKTCKHNKNVKQQLQCQQKEYLTNQLNLLHAREPCASMRMTRMYCLCARYAYVACAVLASTIFSSYSVPACLESRWLLCPVTPGALGLLGLYRLSSMQSPLVSSDSAVEHRCRSMTG